MASFAPITIKEAYLSGTGFPKITDNTLVSIIARVTSVAEFKYKIIYELRDLTGTINAVFWLDEHVPTPAITKNIYVQVFGIVQEKDDKITTRKELLAFKILEIAEVDAITCHYLQCFHKKHMDPLYYEKVMFNFFKNTRLEYDSETGISLQQIYGDLELQKIMSKLEIGNTLNTLWDRGYIYSTSDEKHFKITTAFDEVYYPAVWNVYKTFIILLSRNTFNILFISKMI